LSLPPELKRILCQRRMEVCLWIVDLTFSFIFSCSSSTKAWYRTEFCYSSDSNNFRS
jgi:hypothetical protein